MTSTIIRTVALLSVLIGASAVLSSPSNAITAELAARSRVLSYLGDTSLVDHAR